MSSLILSTAMVLLERLRRNVVVQAGVVAIIVTLDRGPQPMAVLSSAPVVCPLHSTPPSRTVTDRSIFFFSRLRRQVEYVCAWYF
ncbi:hypothetical protein J6590_088983 [Homalodisca vitripennis]|nr:hypothetical protein J6590_088983 [Homalodisca vitripennis]